MGNVHLKLERYINHAEEVDCWRAPDCCDNRLCRRASCEFCGKLMQHWFVEQANLLFPNVKDLVAITITLPELFEDYYEGGKINFRHCTRVIREKIIKAGLLDRIWFGGLDIAIDERVYGTGKLQLLDWNIAPHAMLFTKKLSRSEKNRLRDCMKSSTNVDDPLVETNIYSDGIFNYGIKPNFVRRVKYDNAPKGSKPMKYPLSGKPLNVIRSILAKHDHADRIIAIGAKRIGNGIVVIT